MPSTGDKRRGPVSRIRNTNLSISVLAMNPASIQEMESHREVPSGESPHPLRGDVLHVVEGHSLGGGQAQVAGQLGQVTAGKVALQERGTYPFVGGCPPSSLVS